MRADLAFRARALAQAHPLTPAAQRLIAGRAEREGREQPFAEAARWAQAAAVAGYCVRCVEESERDAALGRPAARPGIAGEAPTGEPDSLDRRARLIAAALRDGRAEEVVLGSVAEVIGALEHLAATEAARRLDPMADEVDDSAWEEAGAYLLWWVLFGYGLRAAEAAEGAVPAEPVAPLDR